MKVNGFPTFLRFKKVKCPNCGMMCAMEFMSGPKKGCIECMSSDHIKPCHYFSGDELSPVMKMKGSKL